MTINIFVANKTFPSFLFVFSQQALSNVHSVRATATDKDPLTWNFNPKVLSTFTLLTLYREILAIRLQYPSFLASILRYKAEANGELIVFIVERALFRGQGSKIYLDHRQPRSKRYTL